jgi:rod shape-determining protein MreC
MRTTARRTWQRLRLLAVLVGLAAFLLLMPSRFTAPARVLFEEAAGPAQTGLYQATGSALALSGTLTDPFLRQDRQRALEREVGTLRNEMAALQDELLRREQDLSSLRQANVREQDFHVLRAPVSSYDTSGTRRSIAARAGSRDGVGPGMAVANEGALVGVVIEAGPRQCRVRLITDPDSAVPCRLSSSRALCILQGTGSQACDVDWLDPDSFAEAGETLVTASLHVDGRSELRLPDGLPAATVLRVGRDPMRPAFLAVSATPRVNLERLEAVEVLIPGEE